MYTIDVKHDSFDILWQGRVVMQGVRPVVSFEEPAEGKLAMKGYKTEEGNDIQGSYISYTVEYGLEEGLVSLAFHFKCYEDILLAYVQSRYDFSAFKKVNLLEAVGGIKLQVAGFGTVEGLMANYLYYLDWWTRPSFGKSPAAIPPRTQSVLWSDGTDYHHIMPFCADAFRTELCGNNEGVDILVSTYAGGYSTCNTLAFILGSGRDPYRLSESTVRAGFQTMASGAGPREARRYPELLEYLGWCTWDAFYHDVTAKGIEEKLAEFKQQGLPVKWVMIDDGWSELKDGRLMSFREDLNKFPHGLKGIIETLKQEYGVKWVGVWHNFLGYWNGIHPDSGMAAEMKDVLLVRGDERIIPDPDAGKGFLFWNAWHSYLKKQGVEFVKVDNQGSLVHHTRGHMAIGKAARGAHAALEASVGINFDNNVINCMGMALEQLWSRPVSAVSRNSDDFYPRKENSFKEHALQNAYNAFYHGNFFWGDWDMWWTKHEQDINNAVLRAVSGGPLYTSDSIGKTDPDKLWPLILSDGRVLRCDRPGLPTADCLLKNPNEERVPLKIWNTVGKAGMIGVFNIHKEGNTVEGTVSAQDIPGIEGDRFVMLDALNRSARIVGGEERIPLSLADNGVALYVFIPLRKESFTPVGLVNKYAAPATVERVFSHGGKVMVVLKEGGLFGFTGEACPGRIAVNGEIVGAQELNGLYTVDCSHLSGSVLVEIE